MMAEAEPGEDPQAADVRRCMVTIKRDQFVEILRTLGACSDPGDAVPWAQGLPEETTAAEAWALCSRGDWLVWLLGELHVLGLLTRQTLVLAACAAARTALGEVKNEEQRARVAIETAEAWSRGAASIDDVRAAADWGADNFTADDAWCAVSAATDVADATDDVVNRAHWAAWNAVDVFYDAEARSKRNAEIADAVRAAVPWSTVEAAVASLCEGKQS